MGAEAEAAAAEVVAVVAEAVGVEAVVLVERAAAEAQPAAPMV